MTKAIRIYETGDANVLKWEDIEVGEPASNEVRLRHTAVGLNFIDIYFRTGTYPAPSLPFTPGLEGVGIVEAIGNGVDDIAVGDRVAYAAMPLGAYAQSRLMPADRLVKLPQSLTDQDAAAMMLKGMTAHYLLKRAYTVKAGDIILFHAAAGGVGQIACQWAKYLGATIIGTVGSEQKAELAKACGCDYPVIYTQENFVERVQEITNGEGVSAVYDSVGSTTFMQSLDCLKPLGTMVSFGQSAGKVPPLDIGVLSAKGSLFLTRPTLMTYTAKRSDLVTSANDLFDVVGTGAVSINISQTYALADAAVAQRDLESRRTTGSSILLV